ncbi:UNVERIFIED_CONTAM: hypothetical protein GTU68_038502 [Idotea baltica]|nr:hypothetical protein [Idotea baltica]
MFVLVLFAISYTTLQEKGNKPNIIIVFADDLGYGDLGCYGAQDVKTPNIDQLASEGMRFTDFQVPSSVCSPSRAALLTGRYPMRNGFPVAQNKSEKHKNYTLHKDEITIAELLLEQEYATMCIGKWHLGFKEDSQPLDHGFQEYYGILANAHHKSTELMELVRDKKGVQEKVSFEDLIKSYTNEAIHFLERNKENPFFLYLAYNAVHSPIRPSKEFIGSSQGSLYGDYVQELDHYVGELMNALNKNGLDENTMVVFLSDNGPALCFFGGSAGPLNAGKYSTMEGGFRVPAIVRWKGTYPTGTSDAFLSSMDLFPTIATVTDAAVPTDRVIDGKDISSILENGGGDTPHELMFYYNGVNLQAIRKGKWKLHLPRTLDDQPFWSKKRLGKGVSGNNLKNISCKGLEVLERSLLFNLDTDMGELTDLSTSHPYIVEELLSIADKVRAELGDIDIVGTDQRLPPFDNIQEKD